MSSLGEQLRTERQKQNRTISEIASSTCISSRYLLAMEADDLKALPGGLFIRSFVKQYCAALDLDFAQVEPALLAALPEEPSPDPLPVLSETYQIARPIHGNRLKTTWIVAMLLVAVAGSSVFYAWWQKAQVHPSEETVQAAYSPQPAPPQAAPQAAAPAVTPPAESQVVKPEQAPAQATPEPAVNAAASDATKLSLDFSATEKTWISISSGGKTVLSGVLDAGEHKALEGVENARLITGNAAGLDVRFNGKPIGPLGERGQVRTVLFTPEKFEILPPKGM